MAKMDGEALFSSLRDNLFTAVVGDVLDKVRIAPDDLIFGNREGVLVIPADVEGEAAAAALAKASTENKIASPIRGGMSARCVRNLRRPLTVQRMPLKTRRATALFERKPAMV